VPRARSYLEYSTKLFLAFAIPGAAGLYILAQPLIGIFTTPAYMVGGELILLLALGSVLYGLYQMHVLIILLVQQTRWIPLMFAVAVVATIGIDLILIPRIGISGAVIATLVSCLILAVITLAWSNKVINYKLDFKFIAKVTAGALLMTFCLSFIKISGVLGIMIVAIAGALIFALWMWLIRAFSTEDRNLIKEIILGLRSRA
jgi:O-antigen/teichoic acid export membrane protein